VAEQPMSDTMALLCLLLEKKNEAVVLQKIINKKKPAMVANTA